jgi:cytochrome P450
MGIPGLGKGIYGTLYVLTDPNEMQKVIRQERGKQPYPRGIVESEWPLVDWLHSKESILGKGTNDAEDKIGFAGRGETWKRIRTFMQTDMLSPQSASGYIPIMAEAAMFASKGALASSADLNGFANRCSFDLFTALMFGTLSKMADPETGHDQENIDFCNAAVNGMDKMLKQMTSPLQLMLHRVGIKTDMYKEMSQSFGTAFDIAEKKYQKFRKRSDANELTEAEKSSYLGRAIIRQAEDDTIREEELAEIIKVALTAAIDTTSSLLSWNLLHLALNPEVQEKLHAEILESTTKCGGLSAEALRKANVPYLHAVLRETHRLTPAAPLTVFKENSLSDLEIHGSIIPKDSLLILDGYSVGLDERIVDNPKEFRPERWFPEAVEARKGTPAEIIDHPYYRDAFSQGSRKCPGSRVANNEVLLLISQLVLDWEITPPKGYGKDDVTYCMHGMVHPDLPKLNFQARN